MRQAPENKGSGAKIPGPLKKESLARVSLYIAHPPGVRPGLIINHTNMAWRPYSNLVDGELDNRNAGKVTGWMRFYRSGKRPLKVTFDLEGDFRDDIRGKVIKLTNPTPSDDGAGLGGESDYMEGFSSVQRGTAGDITAGLPLGTWTEELARKFMAQNEKIWQEAGLSEPERNQRRQEWSERYRNRIEEGELYYPYVDYPYIEWYSEENGRVVLELDPSQVEVVGQEGISVRQKTAKELARDVKKREMAMMKFMSGMLEKLSGGNRKQGGDGNVSGAVIG